MYNGYTNYETWSVFNTLMNTQSLYNFCQDMIKESAKLTKDRDECKVHIMKLLKTTVKSMRPETNNPIWSPIINAVTEDHINFAELADALMEDYKEDCNE